MSLIEAVRSGSIDEVKRLLDSKINPNETDLQHQTALHVAVQEKHINIVTLLLQKCKKIDINIQDNQGWTPLLCAVIDCNYEICELLLNNKTLKPNISNHEFNTPLIYFCKRRTHSNIESLKYKNLLNLFLKYKIDVNERNKFGEAAIHYAAMSNNHDAIDFLYKNNCNMNAINNRGETPLHYALASPDINIIKKLIKCGSDPNMTSHTGKSLLSLTNDNEILDVLKNSNSHNFIITQNLKSFQVINDNLIENITNLDNIRILLQDRKKDCRNSVDTQRTIQKFTSMTKSQRRVYLHLANDLNIYDRLNNQLFYARSGNWVCCVFKIKGGEDHTTSKIFSSLNFIEEVFHDNILPVIQLRRITNEIHMFVSYPSLTLSEYILQQKYISPNGFLEANTINLIALHIAKGLQYLHNNDIIARCINPSHLYILMKEKGIIDKIVIAPFYIAKEDSLWSIHSSNFQFYENKAFIAPEIRYLDNFCIKTTQQSDIWSFGIVLFQLLSLQEPYYEKGLSEEEIQENMKIIPPNLPQNLQSDKIIARKRAVSLSELRGPDLSQYQILIDLFRVCTNMDPDYRPRISDVVKSLSSKISIKEICGLSIRNGPASLKDWIKRHRTTLHFPCIINSPIICKTDNYNIEKPLPKDDIETPNPRFFQFLDNSVAYYAKGIAMSPHENYKGITDNNDICFISIEQEGLYLNDQYNYKALIRTKEEDTRVLISCENTKDRTKMLKQHPTIIDYNLQLIKDPTLKDLLCDFEKNQLEATTYKFGVIYRKKNQISDDDMLSNEHGSPEFNRFLSFLGEKITLKGWNKYRGGLDTTSDTTGTEAIYTTYKDFEIMFHTSTLLPYDKGNPQQLHRKRHIGNDVIVIIFQDIDADPFSPSEFASHFNHVFVVIQEYKKTKQEEKKLKKRKRKTEKLKSEQEFLNEEILYQISIICKDSIKEQARPFLREPCIYPNDDDFRDLFITKLINCERVAMRSEQFEKRLMHARGQLLTHLDKEISESANKDKRKITMSIKQKIQS